MSSADFFSILAFLKCSFRNNIRMSNSLDPNKAKYSVRPDLDPNCLQRLSAGQSVAAPRQNVNFASWVIFQAFFFQNQLF